MTVQETGQNTKLLTSRILPFMQYSREYALNIVPFTFHKRHSWACTKMKPLLQYHINIVSSLKDHIVSVKKKISIKVILFTTLCKDCNDFSFRIPNLEKD